MLQPDAGVLPRRRRRARTARPASNRAGAAASRPCAPAQDTASPGRRSRAARGRAGRARAPARTAGSRQAEQRRADDRAGDEAGGSIICGSSRRGLAEADGRVAVARCSARAGLPRRRPRESARLAARQLSGFLPACVSSISEPKESGVAPGDRARAEQVAGPQVAAVRGLVRDDLRRRPVRIAEAAARQSDRRLSFSRCADASPRRYRSRPS